MGFLLKYLVPPCLTDHNAGVVFGRQVAELVPVGFLRGPVLPVPALHVPRATLHHRPHVQHAGLLRPKLRPEGQCPDRPVVMLFVLCFVFGLFLGVGGCFAFVSVCLL